MANENRSYLQSLAMPFAKGQSGNPKGKKPGTLARHTVAAKDAIQLAAEGLGGTDRLIAWAQEDPLNERAFWASIYPKLLPLTLSGDPKNPVKLVFGWKKD